MKILVTGAAGFIGSHLSETLKDMGHDVSGIDNFNPYYKPQLKELNAAHLQRKGIHIHKADLTEDDLMVPSKDAEIVFHLAAQPGISSTTPFENYLRNNFVSTYRLLEALKYSSNLKLFVNISTSSVYGAHATEDESSAPKPTSHYGVTKLAAEQLALSYYRDKDLPVASARLFSVYGERERPEKLYPKLIDAILKDKPFPLYEGSEHHLRSYTYVGDIVTGLTAIMRKASESLGEIFNIGSDTAITTGEGIRIVEEVIGKKALIDVKPKRAGDQKETHANITKAREVLGYVPATTPQEGLKREVEWFTENIFKKGIDLYN
jgi:UDP-glucuronate 4-epimerase